MKQSELKQLVKSMVRESLVQILMEMKLDQLVGESIERNMGKKNIIQEKSNNSQQKKDLKTEENLLALRRRLLDEQHGTRTTIKKQQPKNILEEVLQDTENSGFIIGNSEKPKPGMPDLDSELVSEDTLDVLMDGKDYSKFF